MSDKADWDADNTADIVEHMNADHSDALEAYVKAFAGFRSIPVDGVKMTGIDASGIDLSVWQNTEVKKIRISYSSTGIVTELKSRNEVRAVLVKMARKARSELDEPG